MKTRVLFQYSETTAFRGYVIGKKNSTCDGYRFLNSIEGHCGKGEYMPLSIEKFQISIWFPKLTDSSCVIILPVDSDVFTLLYPFPIFRIHPGQTYFIMI